MPIAQSNVKTKRYNILSITRSYSRKTGHIFLRARHYSLYIRGKIGLTFSLLFSLFDPMNELGKLEQICHAKGSATGSHYYTGIRGGKAGPGRW
jgi:hypothetical protein